MEREQFDALARLVWTKASRRIALGTLLGAGLLGSRGDPVVAKGKNKRKRKRKSKKLRPCYPGRTCIPGQGKDNAGCDFTESTQFHQLEAHGSNLSQANFTGAQMAEADLRGVDLGGACLVGANLLGATIDGSTNLKDAIFCRTLMPDGSLNDSGCDQGTRCCPAPAICQPDDCAGAIDCQLHGVGDLCTGNWIPFPNHCCDPLVCTPTVASPFVTFCQIPCDNDQICHDHAGPNFRCGVDPADCFYLPGFRCCRPAPPEALSRTRASSASGFLAAGKTPHPLGGATHGP